MAPLANGAKAARSEIRRLRFLTRCAVAFQSILCHTRGSVLAPMPEAALSFTSIGFRDLDLSVKTRGKWAHFRVPHPLPAGDFRIACAWPTRFRDSSGLTAFRIRDDRT